MKEVRVYEAMKSPVGTLSDGTVLHQASHASTSGASGFGVNQFHIPSVVL